MASQETVSVTQAWIESVTGAPFDAAQSFEENLKTGVVLCELINKIKPGSVKKINKGSFAMKHMENISMFQRGCMVRTPRVKPANADRFEETKRPRKRNARREKRDRRRSGCTRATVSTRTTYTRAASSRPCSIASRRSVDCPRARRCEFFLSRRGHLSLSNP